MQRTIEHRCGHSSIRIFTGTAAEQEQKRAWLSELKCYKCWDDDVFLAQEQLDNVLNQEPKGDIT